MEEEEIISEEEIMHLYENWESEYAEKQAEWYIDNL